MPPRESGAPHGPPRHGVARVLSKLGLCSRTQAAAWVRAGRVTLNGRTVVDPEHPVRRDVDRLAVDDRPVARPERVYLMLNKPRGLVTTASDERGRDTVYACVTDVPAPWLAPVGRLDRASEGLLLMTNDPAWAAAVAAPETGPEKTYHVQVDAVPDAALVAHLLAGVTDAGERLRARAARVLRTGARNGWLEIVLAGGRNREIRRLLAARGVGVRRLVRVAIGDLALGDLPKGRWRTLAAAEVRALGAAAHDRGPPPAGQAPR